jgi:uncharacterized OsmC-like protein
MGDRSRIRTAFERNRKALSLRPGIGRNTARTRVRVADGLTCVVEEGPWTLTVDMGEKHGGEGRGPNPGTLGRGALGSCLAIGYAMWFAFRDVPLDGLEIEIEADYDSGAMYGVSDVPPGYSEIRYNVAVESPAPEAEVLRVLDEADAHSPYRDVFSRAQRLVRHVRVVAPQR